MTRQERDQLRALIDQASRARIAVARPGRNPDRDPHPRRDYWREWKQARKDRGEEKVDPLSPAEPPTPHTAGSPPPRDTETTAA